ncbi:hypothetical protein IAR55_004589 [Kwoniella newhampshirensis]|uniref:Uncharacterized protein n=1 Tax=Kwoniella newhampshirensis TaxID=1651941 RepID=A0AAW0YK01_9TREE
MDKDPFYYVPSFELDLDLNLTLHQCRKRTASSSQKQPPDRLGRRTPSGSGSTHVDGLSERPTGKQREQDGKTGIPNIKDLGSEPPSLNVDIRNSLILPSLSQRFSVLIPSLSTASEESLRSLLASQRARHNGPALTEEEEELLFAEIRGTTNQNGDEWDGQPPTVEHDWTLDERRANGSHHGTISSGTTRSFLTTSMSSPSVLASSDDGRSTTPTSNGDSPFSFTSPPPTSNSFTSFQTFGVGAETEQPDSAASANVKTKSYGFSGGSGMRDGDYIRRVKKGASHKNLKNSVSSRKSDKSDDSQGTPTKENVPLPPMISTEKANAYYQGDRQRLTTRSTSPTISDRTATPTSTLVATVVPMAAAKSGHSTSSSLSLTSRGHSPSSSLTLRSRGHSPASSVSLKPPFPPPTGVPPPTPDSPNSPLFPGTQRRSRQRKSLLAGLSKAQVKRISLALEEIGGELQRGNSMVTKSAPASTKLNGMDEEEEMLEPENLDTAHEHEEGGRSRRPSDLRSEGSVQSATSSVFPFQMSPTNSTFTGNPSTEPNSPSKLPPSPRSHNLLAHVADPLPSIPMPVFTPRKSALKDSPPLEPVPVFTPTRSLPVRHQPTLSTSSSSSQVPPNAVYIPGQPRPVRSMHHSEGSMSSRAPTPSSQSPLDALRAATASPDRKIRVDASSSPLQTMPMISVRSTSLAQSRSVNQVSTTPSRTGSSSRSDEPSSSYNRRRAGTVGDMSRRSSSSMANHSPNADIIEERDEISDQEELEKQSSSDHVVPQLKLVPARRSVAESRRESEASVNQLRHNVNGRFSPREERDEQVASIRGTIINSDEVTTASTAPSSAPMSPTMTLRRSPSGNSHSSSFVESEGVDVHWAHLFDNSRPSSSDVEEPESPGAAVEILRKLSGVGIEEMALFQGKLVQRAKVERQAVRGDLDASPVVPYTPPMSAETFKSPSSQRPLSPPTTTTSPSTNTWRFPVSGTSPQPGSAILEPSQAVSSVDTHILTPPLTGPLVARSGSRSGALVIPLRPAPPPPARKIVTDTPSTADYEPMYTPPSASMNREASTSAAGRLALDEDPEVRRDFETRIAKATAALNRTPSSHGGKLGRKPTKRGPMVISSPTLVSTTAKLPTTPLTPENPGNSSPAKTPEKTGGSASKMSLRWKKFAGLRKGSSASNQPVTSMPGAISSPSPVQPQLLPTNWTHSQPDGLHRAHSQSATKKLDEPIALRPSEETAAFPPSAPPDINSFRFPPRKTDSSPTNRTDQTHEPVLLSDRAPKGIKQMITTLDGREGSPEDDNSLPSNPSFVGLVSGHTPPTLRQATSSSAPTASDVAARVAESQHFSTLSEDSALAKFVEAGRQLGLNEDQINDMLAAKDMSARSGAPASTGTDEPTAPTSQLTPTPSSSIIAKNTSGEKEKAKKGLFQALSRSRKIQPAIVPAAALSPSSTARSGTEPVHDKVVVRRTMILPEGLKIIPSTPETSSTPNPNESPDLALRSGQTRKQSIRRKPINLSQEDQALVQSSPPAHRGNFSRVDVPSEGEAKHGLGFLHPNTTLTMSDSMRTNSNASISASPAASADDRSFTDSHQRSSTGGSLIDMYADDYESEEVLQTSPVKRAGGLVNGERPSTQALEICEYADGEVVWSIVDALRTSVTGSVDGEEYAFDSAHSRSTSYASSRRDSSMPVEGGDMSPLGWPKHGGVGVAGLNFRHRDRDAVPKPRPPTDVYFTSSRDVADLIDHLSRDLDASHGRIDILPSHSPSNDTRGDPAVYKGDEDRPPQSPSPTNGQFDDAPSPAPPPRRAPPPAPISPQRANAMTANVPAAGFSPKRQLFVKQNMMGHKQGQHSFGSGLSPSAASFSSSVSGVGPRTVEDRLQALLDKLKEGGAGH